MSSNYLSTIVFVLSTLANGAQARRGGGSGGGGGGGGAEISVYRAAKGLRRDSQAIVSVPYYQISTGMPFQIIILLAAISLLASYIIYTLFVAYDLQQGFVTHTFQPVFYAMLGFTEELADVLIAGAMLLLIYHRAKLNNLPPVPWWKKTLDIVMITSLSAFVVVLLSVTSAIWVVPNYNVAFNAWLAFFHLYTAVYVLITANIVISAIVLSSKLSTMVIQDHMIRKLAADISPLLSARALFQLIDDIITSLPFRQVQMVDFDALRLAGVIIQSLIYVIVLAKAIGLSEIPKPPKTEDSNEKAEA
ncbi:hypothetical protein BDQ12DRAFT_669543 [Crucibulum laeve]|uniref:Gustatory receptor n=1 Tax=Crucibulum laeve TaxID=68775 RepID=A0A5C3LN98_9AGAR|nr:hypothetical protein BDQ12DRAFT_669543 [Crucibulum laeve]